MALSLALRTCKISLGVTRNVPSIYYYTSYKKISHNQKSSVYKSKEAKKIRFYILNRFIEYLKNYDKVLEKNFPTAMKTYRVFVDGIKMFSIDTKAYFKIVIMLNSPGGSYTKLLRREIELYHQMPREMIKVAPVLVFSSLPFAFYILLPSIYAFPKQLLTAHFWTLEQKSKFGIEYLHKRLMHNKPVLRHLQSQLPFIKHHNRNKKLHDKWDHVLGLLGSGGQPKVADILCCKELFMDEPYHLYYISRNHAFHLLKIHKMHAGWFRRTRLADKALIIMEMDKAILREGGVHNMPLDALRNSCYIRGLHPANVSTDHMVKWMVQWIEVSSQVDRDSLSLLLHCPILLGYNEPSNWSLIYPPKT